ncbi:MAG: AzlC family ABC transporter permease [Dehalobacterium sp.]|jgi:4-azaleucine resistance transporter AzlC
MQIEIDQVKLGIKKALPIGMGYLPLGLAFGVIAHNAGLAPFQVGLLSLLLFSGSGQFIAAALMVAGASLKVIVLTVLLVNSRYFLFSATLSRYVKKLPLWCTGLISLGVTDENFVVATTHFQDNPVRVDFWLSLHLTSHLVWISSTVLGSVVGNFIPDMERFGLNFALPAMFIALFFMTASNLKSVFAGIVAGIISLTLLFLGYSDVNVILATIIAATIGVVINKWNPGS